MKTITFHAERWIETPSGQEQEGCSTQNRSLRKRKEFLSLKEPKTDPCGLVKGSHAFIKYSPGQPLSRTHLLSFGELFGWSDFVLALLLPWFMPSLFSLLQHWSCSDTQLESKNSNVILWYQGEDAPLRIIWVNFTLSAQVCFSMSPSNDCPALVWIPPVSGKSLLFQEIYNVETLIIVSKWFSHIGTTSISPQRTTQNKLQLLFRLYIWKWFSFFKRKKNPTSILCMFSCVFKYS